MYITEAHPSDVWQMQSNIKDNVVFASPKSEEERALVAGACVRKLGIKIPAVLDEFGNSTEQAYTGWPDRLYLIDATGRIAYKSKPGPFGFKPDDLKSALSSRVQLVNETESILRPTYSFPCTNNFHLLRKKSLITRCASARLSRCDCM